MKERGNTYSLIFPLVFQIYASPFDYLQKVEVSEGMYDKALSSKLILFVCISS